MMLVSGILFGCHGVYEVNIQKLTNKNKPKLEDAWQPDHFAPTVESTGTTR